MFISKLLKTRSHCGGNEKYIKFPTFSVVMEWVQYPFMTTTAMETIIMAMEKMGIMESSDGVHTAAAMAMEKFEFLNPFRCRCRRNVNHP